MSDEPKYAGMTAEEVVDTATWMIEHYKHEPNTEERDAGKALLAMLDRIEELEAELAVERESRDEDVSALGGEIDQLRAERDELRESLHETKEQLKRCGILSHQRRQLLGHSDCAMGRLERENDELREALRPLIAEAWKIRTLTDVDLTEADLARAARVLEKYDKEKSDD